MVSFPIKQRVRQLQRHPSPAADDSPLTREYRDMRAVDFARPQPHETPKIWQERPKNPFFSGISLGLELFFESKIHAIKLPTQVDFGGKIS
jgi:hypothetical protein